MRPRPTKPKTLEVAVDIVPVIESDRSQIIRLPEAYRMNAREVAIKRVGHGIVLLPIDEPWQVIDEALAMFEPGFELGRQ